MMIKGINISKYEIFEGKICLYHGSFSAFYVVNFKIFLNNSYNL